MGRKKKEQTPAQKARASWNAKHGARGRRNANLWLIQCWRTGEDLVFTGDARAEHYYACEGDSTIQEACYAVQPVTVEVAGAAHEVCFDARVVHRDGRVEYRKVGKTAPTDDSSDVTKLQAHLAAAIRLGGSYRPIGLRDLDLLRTRTTNWRRALRFLRAARHHPLGIVESDVRLRFAQRASMTIGGVVDSLQVHEESLVVATAIRLVLKRVLRSDLDKAPLSRHTRLSLEASQ